MAGRTLRKIHKTKKINQKNGLVFHSFFRNSDTILSSMIGGAIVGSYINPGLGSIIGGAAGVFIGIKHKEKHQRSA